MFLFDFPLLSLLIWMPILGGIWVLIAGAQNAQAARVIALIVSLVTFAASIPLLSLIHI